ncbi:hypothetical protein NC653_025657 [Populus alba x Populus x berolinensis]|uniref:Uncharacterized protein n=1 Tax=Populus alba x Populus x berolinensis TaxID=444605 RepID=A0AAD6ME39_9ROSI|nr:hypothetical protein NC653_025657 [Populus alba x Populus x berolinensis]
MVIGEVLGDEIYVDVLQTRPSRILFGYLFCKIHEKKQIDNKPNRGAMDVPNIFGPEQGPVACQSASLLTSKRHCGLCYEEMLKLKHAIANKDWLHGPGQKGRPPC